MHVYEQHKSALNVFQKISWQHNCNAYEINLALIKRCLSNACRRICARDIDVSWELY